MTGVLVLGSAPTVCRGPYPEGLARWCVNGSIGLVGQCDTHVILGKMLNEDTRSRLRTRVQLEGATSARLIVAYQDVEMPAAYGYTTGAREFLPAEKCAAVQVAAGADPADTTRARTSSTGLLAVCLALVCQSGPVVVSGFSFRNNGHFYDTQADTKWHRDVDPPIWAALHRRWPTRLFCLGGPLLALPAWETYARGISR